MSIIIKSNPSSLEVYANEEASFTVIATGESLKYQWQYLDKRNDEWLDAKKGLGCNSNIVIYRPARTFRNGYLFRCKIVDAYGNVVYSDSAVLKVFPELTILEHPVSLDIDADSTATFSVKAKGLGLSYRWEQRSSISRMWEIVQDDSGQTDTLTLNSELSKYNGYQYRCRIVDDRGNILYTDIVTLNISSK